MGGFSLGSSRSRSNNILCSTEYLGILYSVLWIMIVYFKMCDTQAYSAAYACDVFGVSFDSLFFEFDRYTEEKG